MHGFTTHSAYIILFVTVCGRVNYFSARALRFRPEFRFPAPGPRRDVRAVQFDHTTGASNAYLSAMPVPSAEAPSRLGPRLVSGDARAMTSCRRARSALTNGKWYARPPSFLHIGLLLNFALSAQSRPLRRNHIVLQIRRPAIRPMLQLNSRLSSGQLPHLDFQA